LFSVRFVRPLLETVAYILAVAGLALGWVSWPLALLVLLSTAGMGMLLSMAAVSLRELAEYRARTRRGWRGCSSRRYRRMWASVN
jgi:ABC-type transport system involved in cytochrome bd biosynthesis fused ATPase/permease subunit